MLHMRSTCRSLNRLITPLVFSAITLTGIHEESRSPILTIALKSIALHVSTMILFSTKIDNAEWKALALFKNVNILYICNVQFDVVAVPADTHHINRIFVSNTLALRPVYLFLHNQKITFHRIDVYGYSISPSQHVHTVRTYNDNGFRDICIDSVHCSALLHLMSMLPSIHFTRLHIHIDIGDVMFQSVLDQMAATLETLIFYQYGKIIFVRHLFVFMICRRICHRFELYAHSEILSIRRTHRHSQRADADSYKHYAFANSIHRLDVRPMFHIRRNGFVVT